MFQDGVFWLMPTRQKSPDLLSMHFKAQLRPQVPFLMIAIHIALQRTGLDVNSSHYKERWDISSEYAGNIQIRQLHTAAEEYTRKPNNLHC